jgi:hypothetical protein
MSVRVVREKNNQVDSYELAVGDTRRFDVLFFAPTSPV